MSSVTGTRAVPSPTPAYAIPQAAAGVATTGRPGRGHLSYVHSFRAMAITVIVAGHMLQAFDWEGRPGLESFLLDLIENGTVLFVFVAGFLFQHLSQDFRYGDYLHKKLLNVILPYVIVATPAVVDAVFFHDPTIGYPFLADHSKAWQAAWYYLEGGAHANFPLWFVPMIAVFYVAAPLFLFIDRRPRLYAMLLVLLPLAALAHRPAFPNLQTFQLAAYYFPVYLSGMWASANRVRFEALLRGRLLWLAVGFVLLLAGQTLWAPHHGNYEGVHLFSFEKGLVDWMLPQKMLLTVLLLGVCLRFEKPLAKPLRFLGDASFTVFFLHAYVLEVTLHFFHGLITPASISGWVALTAMAMAICLAVAWAARRVVGTRSRYLIGC